MLCKDSQGGLFTADLFPHEPNTSSMTLVQNIGDLFFSRFFCTSSTQERFGPPGMSPGEATKLITELELVTFAMETSWERELEKRRLQGDLGAPSNV